MVKKADPWGRPYEGIPYNGHKCLLAKGLLEYTYVKLVRFFLRCVSGWPLPELGEKETFFEGKYLQYYNTTLASSYLSLQLWYLIENHSKLTFLETGNMYLLVMLNMLTVSRGFTLCMVQKYKLLAAKFQTQTNVYYHKDQSDYSRHIYYRVHKICTWFTIYQTGIYLFSLILFTGVPTFMNYRNGMFETFNRQYSENNTKYELSFYVKLPFDAERGTFTAYVVASTLSFYCSYLGGASIIMFDTFLSIMIFHLWGHFKIILHDLDTFPLPGEFSEDDPVMDENHTKMYSEQEQPLVAKRLGEIIRYHRMIIEFTDEMSDCFGIVLFIYYSFHQVSGCLLLLECSLGGKALARYLPLTIMMSSQLIQISVIFEIIGTMSEKLRDEVYCLPWQFMNTKNRKTVMIFLTNVQEPIHVKAGGLVDVGVTNMAKILKTSISYFTFLRTVQIGDN